MEEEMVLMMTAQLLLWFGSGPPNVLDVLRRLVPPHGLGVVLLYFIPGTCLDNEGRMVPLLFSY